MKNVKKAKIKNNYCNLCKRHIYSKYKDWKRYRKRIQTGKPIHIFKEDIL